MNAILTCSSNTDLQAIGDDNHLLALILLVDLVTLNALDAEFGLHIGSLAVSWKHLTLPFDCHEITEQTFIAPELPRN